MQGFNMGRYYPPDAENAPRFNTSHPLGSRAKKVNQGILTVRFELPFAVWCSHCKPPAIIGQGVRFNAEKKKIGNYYSTPIWSFRMKHTACGGWWEIRTDPKNSEYVVVEGARMRDYGEAKDGEGEMRFLSEEEKERRRTDAFANLEGKVEEKERDSVHKERMEELYEKAEQWRDPYEKNANLRKEFRAERKVLKKEEKYKEGVQERFGLGIEIADEVEGDRVRAGLVEFGIAGTEEGRVEKVVRKPLFVTGNVDSAGETDLKGKKLKAEVKADKSRKNLQQALVGNTRASIDPFLAGDTRPTSKINLGILKRKRGAESAPETATLTSEKLSTPCAIDHDVPPKKPVLAAALVDYDSD